MHKSQDDSESWYLQVNHGSSCKSCFCQDAAGKLWMGRKQHYFRLPRAILVLVSSTIVLVDLTLYLWKICHYISFVLYFGWINVLPFLSRLQLRRLPAY